MPFSIGLLLLLCSGLHTVWAIYQLLFYQTSEVYRYYLNYSNPLNHTNEMNEKIQTTPATTTATTTATTATTAKTATIATIATTATTATNLTTPTILSATNQANQLEWREGFFGVAMFEERVVLMLTIVLWYIGMILGCLVAGWFLVRVVQKKNVYVSFFLSLFLFR